MFLGEGGSATLRIKSAASKLSARDRTHAAMIRREARDHPALSLGSQKSATR